MKNNITKLSFRREELRAQTGVEKWMNGAGVVVAKYLFWVIVFFSITFEVIGYTDKYHPLD